MGRNSKKPANQRDTKHENGVVAPYKKVTKQKSNGHINGSVDGRSQDNAPSVPAIAPRNLTVSNDTASNAHASTTKVSTLSVSEQAAGKGLTVAVSDEVEGTDSADGVKMGEHHHRRIDVSSAKQASASEGGALSLALTVLRSCPIGDTLAILIFLLSLPPTFLNLTNAMFAMLTFVPPSGSFTTLPSLTDITSSFSPATPSFIVLVLIDFLAISLWYLIPFPQLQGMLLDCAQATVATTLGGGYDYRAGTSDNILVMVMVVLVTHLGRYRKTTLRWLHKTRLAKWLPMVDSFDDLPPRPSYVLGANRTWLDTIKIWVAIHILFQGLTRMVRRSLHSSRGTSIFSSHSRTMDPEAVGNVQGAGEASETSHNPPSSPSILKSKSSLQNLRDVRDKISSGKRRRKQATYVRSQQPLWAAFASTKATIIREYEQSQATRDARGSKAEGVEDLGSAPFAGEANQIWITAIRQDRFYFETGPMPCHDASRHEGRREEELEDEAGIDRTKSFYIRINGANWASVKIQEASVPEEPQPMRQWVGEVYGLSPASTYRVSFSRCGDGVELHSEVIVTPSLQASEQASPSNPIVPPTMRPSSPASPVATLKTSIAAFESSVNDTQSQQRRMRKDSRANVMALKKELDVLTEKLARLANSDKGLTSRQLQLSQNIRQAEETHTALAEELESFTEVPDDARAEWQDQKSSWEQTRNEQSRVQEDLQRTKEDNRRNHTSLQAESITAKQKKERLQARTNRLLDQYKRLSSTAGPDHRRTQLDPSLRSVQREHIEGHYQEQINALQRAFQEATIRFQAINSQRMAILHQEQQNERARQAQQSQQQYGSRPITPEGDLPGTNPSASNCHGTGYSRFAAFHTPESHSVLPASGFGSAGTNGIARNMSGRSRRSQSALSGNSLHVESYEEDDEDPIPAQHKRKTAVGMVREGSDGRSSGSGSPHVPHVPPTGHRSKNNPAAG